MPFKIFRRFGLLASLLVLSVAAATAAIPLGLSHAQQALPPALPLARPLAAIPLNQSLRFERFTLEDGLSQNTVIALLQDRQGFIWAATQEGLNRYDGNSFTIFKHDPQNANSLSLNSAIALYEDQAGLLWIGTWGGGLDRYDPDTGQFTHYRNDPQDSTSLSHDVVTAIHEDRQGHLWVATCGGGLNQLDRQTGRFTRYSSMASDPATLSSDNVSTIFEDTSGVLWIGTGCLGNAGAGLNRFDPQSGAATRYPTDPADPHSPSGPNVAAIVQDAAGFLWIGSGGYALPGNGLSRLDPKTGNLLHYSHNPAQPDSLSDNTIMALMLDSAGTLWVGTWGGGLDRVDPRAATETLPFFHQRYNAYDPQSLSSDNIWAYLEDRSGLIWVGTGNGGLNKLNPQVQNFGLYRNNPADPASLAYNAVGPVLEDRQGRIWVSTLGGGLERFDRQAGTFTHYVQPTSDPLSGPANTYLDLYEDHAGTLWLATLGGLGRFDPTANGGTGKTVFYRHDPARPDSLINDGVSNLTEDDAGRLWVGTMAGLDGFDPATERFVHMQIPELGPVFRLYRDGNSTLWVGSFGQGLFKLDLQTVSGSQVSYTRYVNDPANPASLADNNVLDILRDKAGTLWLGTQAGLDRFDTVAQTFSHHQEQGGSPSEPHLVNNIVLCMLEDGAGRLWLSTNAGLSRFDPRINTFRNFDAHDGLQSNEFDSGACGATRAGEMYFGGQKGLNVFRPEAIQDNPTPPPVVVTGFRVFNQPVAADLSGLTPIRLAYTDNFIAFEFVALDFHAPQKNQYAYKLDGFDKDWVNAGARRYASYTNLRGGNYTFRVKAANNDGIWNESGVAIPLQVTPPIWETWWFQAGSVLALLGILAAGVSWRLTSIRAQNRRLEALVEQRTQELRQAQQALAKHAETELQQSEARFQATFESSAIGMALLTLEGKVLRANAAICHISGYPEEALKQQNPQDTIYPEDQALDREWFQELVTGQRDSYQVEKRYVRQTSQVYWARLTLSSVRGPQGQPLYLVGMLEDIDTERRAQEELRQSEARFRAMFDNVAVGMALMTLDRQLLQINQTAARLIGYSVEEARQLNPSDLALPDDRELDRESFQALITGQRDQYQAEKRYQRKDGRVFWGRVSYSLVRGANSQPQYLIGLIEDVDAQKSAAAKLAAQEAEYRRTLEQRVAERTAELSQANTQLQHAIELRQAAEAALAQKAADEAVAADRTRLARDLHDAVTQTLFSASLLAEVMPQLWEFNPAEARKRMAELRELTRGALAEMRTLLLELRPSALTNAALPDLLRQLAEAVTGRARLPVELTVDGDCCLVPEVQVVLYRIAQEALNNVMKYARATQVNVNLRQSKDGSARLTVIDNGIGFDPAAVPPNHLGLRIMRERAETVGAHLSINSEPGEGTQVTVTWTAPAQA
jgi:PAS domain S-box-containing protein